MSQHPPMRCADVAPYLSPFVDGELAAPLRDAVAAHIAGCAACARKVERYRETKRLLGSLPRTTPSPEVFDRIIAAIPERYPEPAARESLGGEARDFSLRRKLSALEQPSFDDERVVTLPSRRTVVTRILPVVAALLLVTLGLLTFGRFSMFGQSPAHTSTPVVGQAYETTQARVAKLRGQLGFTPVLPQTYPPEATLLDASVGSTGLGSYLDTTWGFGNAGYKVHMREAVGNGVWPGYAPGQTDPDLSWQLIGFQPWRPLVLQGATHTTAVGQNRGVLSIAMDVDVNQSSSRFQDALKVLRQLSLSMDLPYRPVAITPISSSQLGQMVLHYTLVGRDAGNHVLWQADGYVDQANGRQRIEVRAGNRLLYTDIISGNSVLRLDATRGTYWPTTLDQLGLSTWKTGPASAARNFFLYANTYVDTVELWNVGTTQYQGQAVYDLEMVDAPAPTHFYVSTNARSQPLVAITVETQSTMRPGGPYATDPFNPPLACADYTLLTYVPASQVPGTGFSTQAPGGYSRGSVQQTVGC